MRTPSKLSLLALLFASLVVADSHKSSSSCHRRHHASSTRAASSSATAAAKTAAVENVKLAASATKVFSTASAAVKAGAPSRTDASAVHHSTTSHSATATTPASTASSTSSHKLISMMQGTTFFDSFDFFNDTDPTFGNVSYVDAETAWNDNLVSVTNTSVYMGIDKTSWLDSGAPRTSTRIQSTELYSEGLFILDLRHMPYGCSTWPAFWLTGEQWPQQGEIDIIEGVNNRTYNQMTLHTEQGCTLDSSASFTGEVSSYSSTECYAYGSSAGCAFVDNSTASYGAGFNAAGGGVFATILSSEGVKMWRFGRSEIPDDITSGSPEPKHWGAPLAFWSASTCDTSSFFKDLHIVFDITVNGEWAGDSATWWDTTASGSCSSTYKTPAEAAQDPANFKEAYWDIASLAVYSV